MGSAPPALGTTGLATPRPSAWPPGGSPAGPVPHHSESVVCVSEEKMLFESLIEKYIFLTFSRCQYLRLHG